MTATENRKASDERWKREKPPANEQRNRAVCVCVWEQGCRKQLSSRSRSSRGSIASLAQIRRVRIVVCAAINQRQCAAEVVVCQAASARSSAGVADKVGQHDVESIYQRGAEAGVATQSLWGFVCLFCAVLYHAMALSCSSSCCQVDWIVRVRRIVVQLTA